MKPCLLWTLVGCGIVVVFLICWFFATSRKKKGSNSNSFTMPQVCSVWDRWETLEEDEEISADGRKLGDSWLGSICPKGNLLQTFNRTDAACVKPQKRKEATTLLCSKQISNDDVAIALPAICSPDDVCAATDHWVTLTQPIKFDNAVKKGNAWTDVNVCESGAAVQVFDNEVWCMVPDDINKKMF